MIPILCTYLLGLLFFTFQKTHLTRPAGLRAAWLVFAMIPFVHVLFTLIHAAAFSSRQSTLAKNLALVEIWKEGFIWLFLGISMLCFISSLFARQTSTSPTYPHPPG